MTRISEKSPKSRKSRRHVPLDLAFTEKFQLWHSSRVRFLGAVPRKKKKKKKTRKCARLTNIGKHLGPSTSHPLRHRRGIIARHVDDRTKGKVNEIPNCFAFVTTDVSFPPFSPPEEAKLHFSRGTRVERRVHSVLPDLERNDQGKSTKERATATTYNRSSNSRLLRPVTGLRRCFPVPGTGAERPVRMFLSSPFSFFPCGGII